MDRSKRASIVKHRLLVVAQLLALITMSLGLQFLVDTTGGTVFAFATLGPLLVGAGVLMMAGVAIHSFVRRHSLFSFVTCEPGQIVFRQGDEGDAAFFIQSGEVEVIRERAGEEPVVVARLSEGYFGEMALLSNAPRNATVRAATTARLAVLGKANFVALCGLIPLVQEDVLRTVQKRATKEDKGDLGARRISPPAARIAKQE
jgi:Cyclic nucleotide-binding domain